MMHTKKQGVVLYVSSVLLLATKCCNCGGIAKAVCIVQTVWFREVR